MRTDKDLKIFRPCVCCRPMLHQGIRVLWECVEPHDGGLGRMSTSWSEGHLPDCWGIPTHGAGMQVCNEVYGWQHGQ